MRRPVAGAIAGLLALALASGGTPAPAAASVSTDPKVVLVVGATHGTTATYRSWMNVVAATAARYTRNMVKIYSPNATWSAVRSALQGASIVVYMGHGNGFPNPYVTTPNPYAQNGMGLNATAGAGDSNTKYYGERYIAAEVKLAPNAVVILSHLCYASGNSEPGRTEPSLATAKARMDNFAAGFLRAGARAVIADGHDDPSWYITQLFATHQTIEQVWRAGPRPRGHVFTFASVRTTGYTVFSDPDARSGSTYSGFYRSMVARPALTTEQVTGAPFARTDGSPAALTVPGAAQVVAAGGTGIFPDATFTADAGTGLAPATLPAGTRLRLLAAAGTAPDGSAAYKVATLDGSTAGFVAAAALAPRDSLSPRIRSLDTGAGALSPNGDGVQDTLAVTAGATEPVTWTVTVSDAGGGVAATLHDAGESLAVTWDGLADGAPVPDGDYTATVSAADGWGNPPTTATVTLTVDTVAPLLGSVAAGPAAPIAFTPNGDGTADMARVTYQAAEVGVVTATVSDEAGALVDRFSAAMAAGAGSTTWDGRTSSGAIAPDGRYTISLVPRDRAGNSGAAASVDVAAFAALRAVASSVPAIHVADADALARSTRLSFVLNAPATVTWEIVGPDGATVVTRLAGANLPAGAFGWTWTGRRSDGSFVPQGIYRARVTATNGVMTAIESATVTVAAFRASLSDSTPARGQLLTLTLVSTEPLAANPTVSVTQPGLAAVGLRTARVSTYVYRVTFRVSSAASPGTLAIRISGRDTRGGRNTARYAWPLH